MRLYRYHKGQKHLRFLRPSDKLLHPIPGDRKQLQPMRKGNPLRLRGEKSTGFPLQISGGNAEIRADHAADHRLDPRVSSVTERA